MQLVGMYGSEANVLTFYLFCARNRSLNKVELLHFDHFPLGHIVSSSKPGRGGARCVGHVKLRCRSADGMVELHVTQRPVLAAGV